MRTVAILTVTLMALAPAMLRAADLPDINKRGTKGSDEEKKFIEALTKAVSEAAHPTGKEPTHTKFEYTEPKERRTVLTINADGESFVHSAYALGMGDPQETGVRKTLLDATTKLSDVVTAAGEANLGPEEPFEPTAYRFQSRVVDPSELAGQDPAPTVVDWPAMSSFALAGATECAARGRPSARCSPMQSRTLLQRWRRRVPVGRRRCSLAPCLLSLGSAESSRVTFVSGA